MPKAEIEENYICFVSLSKNENEKEKEMNQKKDYCNAFGITCKHDDDDDDDELLLWYG